MPRTQLRLFPTVEETPFTQTATVSTTLRDLLPILAHAHLKRAAWLKDFLDDEIVVTSDLAEIVDAYQAVRPSA